MCWFDPPEESRKLVKFHCEHIIIELKRLNKIGDPIGLELKDIKELLDHLWNPSKCKDAQDAKSSNNRQPEEAFCAEQ